MQLSTLAHINLAVANWPAVAALGLAGLLWGAVITRLASGKAEPLTADDAKRIPGDW